MPSAPIRLAVFDCDGTLVDSQARIVAAMQEAFAAHGLPAPPPEAIRRVVGLSLPLAVEQIDTALPKAEAAAISETYRQAYFRMRMAGEYEDALFPGIAELLRQLAGQNWLLGVATGKSNRGLRAVIDRHGFDGLFVTLQTADLAPSKPHPAMLLNAMAEAGAAVHDTVMIGDTTFDVEMALAAGVRPLGVAWGYHSVAALHAAGAAAVANDAPHLAELVGP